MNFLSLLQLWILVIARVTYAAPWDSVRPARYEGYDLERGPVLYEAYYPEEDVVVKQPVQLYQEKRYFDRPIGEERSYQISDDPYELPYEHEVGVTREQYLPSSIPRYSALTAQSPPSVERNEYLRFEQPIEEYASHDGLRVERGQAEHSQSMTAKNYPSTDLHSNTYYGRNQENAVVEPSQMSYGRREYPQHLMANDQFMFSEESANRAPIFEEQSKNANQRNAVEHQSFVADYNRQKQMSSLPIENIFQPRPQLINYVFSAKNNVEAIKPDVFANVPDENDWPRSYGDNLINEEIRKADEQELRNEEAKVASIEVSKVAHHKTRHHHGELPRRNYGRQ